MYLTPEKIDNILFQEKKLLDKWPYFPGAIRIINNRKEISPGRFGEKNILGGIKFVKLPRL